MSELISNKVFEKSTGLYRTHDNIDHFKFRITLCKLDSLIKIPTFDATISHPANNNSRNNTNSPKKNGGGDLVEKTDIKIELKWQQKLFSKHELEYFGKIENLKTETDKSYHNVIKTDQVDRNRIKNNTIYTLVTQDNLDNYKEFIGDDVNYDLTLNNDTNIAFMYIVADFKFTNKILFVIKFDRSTNIFIIYPNFNTTKPYMIEIKSDSRDLYYYSVKNLSKISSAASKNYGTIMKFRKQLPQFNNFIENNNFHVLLLFEIKFYKSYFYNFFNTFIFIKYKIIFPKRYKFSGNGTSTTNTYESLTNSCKYYFRSNSMIHVNFSKEFSVIKDCSINSSDNIRIVFTIMALDYWDRPKIISHTYCVVPVKQGICDKILYSYTHFIKNNNFYNFDSFNYNVGDNLVRYGNETVTAGELGIRFNLLIQNNYNKESVAKNGGGFETDDNNQLRSKCFYFMKLDDILSAYYRARTRFESVHD